MKTLFFIFPFLLYFVRETENQVIMAFGSGQDIAESAQGTSDGGFILAGFTGSFGGGGLLTRYTGDWNHSWTRTFGGNSAEGVSVVEASDGCFIVTGTTNSFGPGPNYNVLLSKFHGNGSHYWTTVLGSTSSEQGYSVQETSDGGYIVTGHTSSFGAGVNDAILSKFYGNGSHDWTVTFGGESDEIGYSVQETSDGGYVVTGITRSLAHPDLIFLSKFASNGSLCWVTIIGEYNTDEGYSVQQTSDEGFVVSGTCSSFGNQYLILLSKFYPNGSHCWTTLVGGSSDDRGKSVQETSDGGFIVAGYTQSYGAGSQDVVLSKFFGNGSFDWMFVFGGGWQEQGVATVSESIEGYYMVGGFTSSFIAPTYYFGIFAKFSIEMVPYCDICEVVIPDVIDYDPDLFIEYNPSNLVVQDHTDDFIITSVSNPSVQVGDVGEIFIEYLIFNCFGEISGNNYTCSSHGNCLSMDVCECVENYYGENCEINVCDGVLSNSTTETFCSDHGECISLDICECNDFYYGEVCEVNQCFGILSNDSDDLFCSGFGNCLSMDVCECFENYYGENCNITVCNEYLSNDTDSVCSSVGICVMYEECQCYENYFGGDCEVNMCFDVFTNMSTSMICSGHGDCVDYDNCSCSHQNYTGENCQIWSCENEQSTSEYVCSEHGQCIDVNICSCWDTELYTGETCEIWYCFDVKNTEENIDVICGSHGYCVGADECFCLNGFDSLTYQGECTEWYCGVFHRDDATVCNERGTCVSSHYCECEDDFQGDLCEEWSCGGNVYTSAFACSGNGDCSAPNECVCSFGYNGDLCQTNVLAIAISVPIGVITVGTLFLCIFCAFVVIGILLCLALICGGCICTLVVVISGIFSSQQAFKIKKFRKLKNFEVLLQEQELEEDESVAHIRIDRSNFEISMDELKFERILGEGGSASVVYLANWKGRKVAFKCFKTRMVCSTQERFDEFEREIGVLGSISHPHVIQCFGCSIEPPRVGIVMEYCSHGDLDFFLRRFNDLNKHSFPMKEKIRVLTEISSSCEYLHSRNIIHRDLKLENVLLDDRMSCKLMDFGLSRIVDRMSLQKTTRVGTCFFMAPEISLSGHYDQKVDVFSFGMMMWIIATELFHPFGMENVDTIGIEFRIANDPNYRPDSIGKNSPDDRLTIKKAVEGRDVQVGSSCLKWYETLMRQCWDNDPQNRPEFSEISKIFLKEYSLQSKEEKEDEEKEQQNMKEQKKNKKKDDIIIEDKDKTVSKNKEKFDILIKMGIEELRLNLSSVMEENEKLKMENSTLRDIQSENENLKTENEELKMKISSQK